MNANFKNNFKLRLIKKIPLCKAHHSPSHEEKNPPPAASSRKVNLQIRLSFSSFSSSFSTRGICEFAGRRRVRASLLFAQGFFGPPQRQSKRPLILLLRF